METTFDYGNDYLPEIPLCPAIDVYNIALEARLMQKLRHTPLFIAVEMCKYPEHKLFVADLLPKIITRAEISWHYIERMVKSLSVTKLRKG